MGMQVNKTELAKIMGKTEATLTTWQKKGMPIQLDGKKGQANLYDTEEVIQWWHRWQLSKFSVAEDGNTYDFEAERARLTHEQANSKARENALADRDTAPLSLLIAVIERTAEQAASLSDGTIANVKRGLPHLEARDLEFIHGELTRLRNAWADMELSDADWDKLQDK